MFLVCDVNILTYDFYVCLIYVYREKTKHIDERLRNTLIDARTYVNRNLYGSHDLT